MYIRYNKMCLGYNKSLNLIEEKLKISSQSKY